MAGDSCKTCRFFKPHKTLPGYGECRRHSIALGWPPLEETEWCGEFEAAAPPREPAKFAEYDAAYNKAVDDIASIIDILAKDSSISLTEYEAKRLREGVCNLKIDL